MASKPEPKCCLYCGRDTTTRSQICARCILGEQGKECRTGRAVPDELEDDYGDEADADSVCRDGVEVIDMKNPCLDKRRNGKRMR